MACVPAENGHVRAIPDRAAYKRRLRLGNIKLFENPKRTLSPLGCGFEPLVSVKDSWKTIADMRAGTRVVR